MSPVFLKIPIITFGWEQMVVEPILSRKETLPIKKQLLIMPITIRLIRWRQTRFIIFIRIKIKTFGLLLLTDFRFTI